MRLRATYDAAGRGVGNLTCIELIGRPCRRARARPCCGDASSARFTPPNGAAAIECIQGCGPDIVLLDIQMPAGTGFEVVDAVGVEQMPPTVFITAHDEFAIRAFDVAAVDYLLKPFDDDRFAAAWQRVSARHGTGELVAQARVMSHLLSSAGSAVTRATNPGNSPAFTDRLVVKQDQRTIVVMLSDVQWMESDANYVVLHAGRDRYQVRETLSSLESRLDPRRFMRIHRRFIVEIRAMKELQLQ